jgi:hypothetical protein
MNDLSADLLGNIQIFKLPAKKLNVSLPMVIEVAAATPDSEPVVAAPQYQLN